MLRKALTPVLAVVLTAALAGCGKKNSEKVVGVWRTAEKRGHVHGYIEIAKDRLTADGAVTSIVLEDRDGKVAMRRAGGEEVIGIISVVDDDNIMVEMSGLGQGAAMVRSSPEAMRAALNPPVKNIIGMWRSEAESYGPGLRTVLEVTLDKVHLDGVAVAWGIDSRNGVYVARDSRGRNAGTLVLLENGKLQTDLVKDAGDFVRSSHEEANLLRRARRDRMTGFFGFWQEVDPVIASRPIRFFELREKTVNDNGERKEAALSLTSGGLAIAVDGGDAVFSAVLQENGRLRVSRGIFDSGAEFKRSTPEELDRLNNPKLEDYVGCWLLEDPASGGFRAVEIGRDYLIRDRRKEPTLVGGRGVNALTLSRSRPIEMPLATLSRVDGDRIRIAYGSYDKEEYGYRQASREEYQKATAGLVNPLSVIIGFWKSEQPVEDSRGESVVHATAAFALDVRGQDGRIVDWSSTSFVTGNQRNRSIDWKDTVREGVFVFPKGRSDEPVRLARIDGNNGSWAQIRVLGDDLIEVSEDGRNFVRMVRTDKDELLRLRAAIRN